MSTAGNMTIIHPQTDGLVEHMNKTLEDLLWKMPGVFSSQWDMFLDPLLFALRETPQASTELAPFELGLWDATKGLAAGSLRCWVPSHPSLGQTQASYIRQVRELLEWAQMAVCNLQ